MSPTTTVSRWPAGTTITVRRKPPYPPAAWHPITRDPAALEKALIAILTSAKQHAARVGTMPEHDMLNEQFRRQHGRLAAMLSNTVEEAHIEALNMLVAHGMLLMKPGPFNAMAERVGAEARQINRHAADTRSRH